MIIYRNVNEFQQDKFGEEIFVKKSIVQKFMSISRDNPNYKDATINKKKLVDMVDIF